MLAIRGARVITVPAAFTLPTTRDHWETLVRARAIENQCFVVAPNQIGEHPGGLRSGGRSLIVDPWGLVLAGAPDMRDGDRRRARRRPDRRRPAADAGVRAPPPERVRVGTRVTTAATEKRRVILDAAVRVFARQGFHTCRVSDIADEAGVAYGLVYHYFSSKEEILDTLFLERWDVMLAAIDEADASRQLPREKLYAIAAFIIDSYRHDPELMKVIIVEVTRAANTFGLTHLREDQGGVRQDRGDRLASPGRWQLPLRGHPGVRRAGLLWLDRAGPDGLDLRERGRSATRSSSAPRR